MIITGTERSQQVTMVDMNAERGRNGEKTCAAVKEMSISSPVEMKGYEGRCKGSRCLTKV